MSTSSALGRALLVLAVGVNFVIATRRGSPWLTALALACGWATVLAVRSTWFSLGGLLVLALGIAIIATRRGWPQLILVGVVLSPVVYLGWAFLNAPAGGVRVALEPVAAPAVVLAIVLVFALAPLRTPAEACDGPRTGVTSLLNCGIGYGVFVLHGWAALGPVFGPAQGAASALFLGIAVVYWRRCHSRVSTFLYAMAGYVALSVAILKFAPMPDVFVWLSVQSILVVTTAIWFRSRFIIVANFALYVGVVLAYMVLKERETGISLGFGVVALVSARLLNWQQHRLELKTELMRNAYLGSGLVVFPYALYHLVSSRWVALAWLGLGLGYYVLSFLFRNPKYRWMGHGTLLGTVLYLAVVGSRGFEPAYRVASFLALGTVLVITSLAFTRVRQRARARGGQH